MIGTIICRNCDTAIEVSERDVSTFEGQGTFRCPSCKEDLSARMADLLGANRPPPSGERTAEDTSDADAFEGLPVGGSLDEAARAMRAAPSSSAGVVPPEIGGEDPLTLALRIAHQAKEHAEKLAAGPSANGAHREPEPTLEPTAPGLGPVFAVAGGAVTVASSEVGVVPEEPDRGGTVRAKQAEAAGAEETITEPTLPSESGIPPQPAAPAGDAAEGTIETMAELPDGRAIPEGDALRTPPPAEETPALSAPQRATMIADVEAEGAEADTVVDEPAGPVPGAPSAEPTPSAPRGVPMEPREEPTIRKSAPPAGLKPPKRLAPRTGTGPAGIGALGFRISHDRAVVRPSINGRAAFAPSEATPSGRPSLERGSTDRVSVERSFAADRPSRSGRAPARAAQPAPMVTPPAPRVPEPMAGSGMAGRPVLPVWLLGAGAGAVAVMAIVLAWIFLGGKKPSAATPAPSPTPIAAPSIVPSATSVLAPATAATPIATTTAMRTALAGLTPTPIPTPAVAATPAATPTRTPPSLPRTSSAKEQLELVVRRANTPEGARFDVYNAAQKEPYASNPEFLFEAWKFLANPPPGTEKPEIERSRKMARSIANEFLKRESSMDPSHTTIVRNWLDKHPN